VKLLLDTHALLWWLSDDPRLSYRAEASISNPENQVFVSACTGYEVAYKQKLGKLPSFPESLQRLLLRGGFQFLPISIQHALAAGELRGPHRDPWDRMMMAQALAERCHMITADGVFSDYGVPVIW
jgi:PIN domain nuclease of toxin-antitoxin system